MLWPMIAIALGFLGLVVLAFFAVRVFVEVRRLGAQVAETSRKITAASSDLERAAAAMARAGRESL
ncbi:hypothetical protein H9Y04_23335 [Streptomyces sp. TRM66268-LWL]|uniref:DUF948 domain-containing protein n=1 Tax=Streptomyces polyasparticus TaxID=2767826 RepID=A0ABR7SJ14_9ACTN|nr:hypothetical protein [Streptomyces polyasparticus]MBC9715486.1 hypothetical protein [Streptomyces polyasparticus]